MNAVLVIVGAGKVLHLRGNMLETLCGVELRWDANLHRTVTAPRFGVRRSEYPDRQICAHCSSAANMRVAEWTALGVLEATP